MADVNITAKPREITTKGAVNQLRRDGVVPGVLYSKEMEPVSFSVTELSLKPVVYTKEMHLVNLKIGENQEVKSILKDVQFDPLTDRIIHVDFQAITVGQVLEVQVPISFIGQAAGVKQGGKLLQNLHKFDIECLPKHIPEHLEVDITNLKLGESILVKDLSFENVKILNSEETNVVTVLSVKGEDEAGDALLGEEEVKEPELIGKAKSEDKEG